MARVVVLGAGADGARRRLSRLPARAQVTLLEAAPEPGGMAAHFDLGGLSIERYYHFVCKADAPTFELLDELGLGDKMRWRPTSMGYFTDGTAASAGAIPSRCCRFPHLNLVEKLRYGSLMFVSTRRDRWPALEHMSAREVDRATGAARASTASSGSRCSI